MQSFIMNSHEVFIHIHQGCFAGTGTLVRLPQCQWSKPDGYGKISQCITTTKHSKAKTVCIFLGIYCSWGSNDTRARISNYNHTKQHGVITVPCPNFNGVLTGWVITLHSNNGCDFYPNPTLSRSLPLKWPPFISILYNNVRQCVFINTNIKGG